MVISMKNVCISKHIKYQCKWQKVMNEEKVSWNKDHFVDVNCEMFLGVIYVLLMCLPISI